MSILRFKPVTKQSDLSVEHVCVNQCLCFEQNIRNGTWHQFSKALLHKFTLPHKLARQNLFQYNKITSAKYLTHPTVLSNNTTNKNYIRSTKIKMFSQGGMAPLPRFGIFIHINNCWITDTTFRMTYSSFQIRCIKYSELRSIWLSMELIISQERWMSV